MPPLTPRLACSPLLPLLCPLCSQFMENWCYDRKTLNSFALHYQTGAPLPDELYQRLMAARTFRSGSMMLRQIHFASVDLELHSRFRPDQVGADADGKHCGAAVKKSAGSDGGGS